jgi:hypothetical protein
VEAVLDSKGESIDSEESALDGTMLSAAPEGGKAWSIVEGCDRAGSSRRCIADSVEKAGCVGRSEISAGEASNCSGSAACNDEVSGDSPSDVCRDEAAVSDCFG